MADNISTNNILFKEIITLFTIVMLIMMYYKCLLLQLLGASSGGI